MYNLKQAWEHLRDLEVGVDLASRIRYGCQNLLGSSELGNVCQAVQTPDSRLLSIKNRRAGYYEIQIVAINPANDLTDVACERGR